MTRTTIRFTDEDIALLTKEAERRRLGAKPASRAQIVRDVIQELRSRGNIGDGHRGPWAGSVDQAALLCQAISARYYPWTRTDQRYITAPESWWDTRDAFVPAEAAKAVGLNQTDTEQLHRGLIFEIRQRDPLKNWHDLITYAAISRKEALAGSALMAQTLRRMEHMLRLFSKEWLDIDLDGPDIGIPELDAEEGPESLHDRLELVVNRYHLNPKPNLVLYVEGESEAAVVEELFHRITGGTFNKQGISLRCLSGIGGFVASKRRDRYGALEKVIEEFHDRTTMVFAILDNEDRAGNVRKKLVTAASRLHPTRRLTREEYITVWKTNTEFDNFTDVEIADAMSKMASGAERFSEMEIRVQRQTFGKPSSSLSKLYEEKTLSGLEKVTLMKTLADQLTQEDFTEARRPLIALLKQIGKLALVQYQPSTLENKLYAQEGGFFGPPLVGEDPAAEYFAPLRAVLGIS